MSKRWISTAGVILFLAAVFCVGVLFFRGRIQRSTAEMSASPTKSLIGKPFPHASLVDVNGSKVDEQILRNGRVIVVFVATDCDACMTESKFLSTFVGKRKDVTFYGLALFGTHPQSPELVEKLFPFRVLYDEENFFSRTMGINRVPVKVFLEDGVIKKGWIGADLTDDAKQSFTDWLNGLP